MADRCQSRTITAPVRLVRNSKPNVDGVVARVSVDVWNAKRRFLERVLGPVSLDLHLILGY